MNVEPAFSSDSFKGRNRQNTLIVHSEAAAAIFLIQDAILRYTISTQNQSQDQKILVITKSVGFTFGSMQQVNNLATRGSNKGRSA